MSNCCRNNKVLYTVQCRNAIWKKKNLRINLKYSEQLKKRTLSVVCAVFLTVSNVSTLVINEACVLFTESKRFLFSPSPAGISVLMLVSFVQADTHRCHVVCKVRFGKWGFVYSWPCILKLTNRQKGCTSANKCIHIETYLWHYFFISCQVAAFCWIYLRRPREISLQRLSVE